eukprot:jgi/Botrbrau1/12997/Bobra.384_1s0021.1
MAGVRNASGGPSGIAPAPAGGAAPVNGAASPPEAGKRRSGPDPGAAAAGDLLPVIHNHWIVDPSSIEYMLDRTGKPACLGRGHFGVVYKGVLNGVDDVAVKQLRESDPAIRDRFRQEISILKEIHSPHIVQFMGACIQGEDMLLITELMDENLHSALDDGRCLWYKGGAEIALDIAKGIGWLHTRTPLIIHFDIKSPNILLKEGRAKLADVGLARVMYNDNMSSASAEIGTLAWTAPEVFFSRIRQPGDRKSGHIFFRHGSVGDLYRGASGVAELLLPQSGT